MHDSDTAAAFRARFAVATIFFVSGFIMGSWAPHIALVKERLALSPGALGLVLLAMAGGAVVAMPLSGPFITRYGSAAVTRVMAIVNCLLLPLPVLAPDVFVLVIALILFGASVGALDVAMNAHGVAVEKRLPRPTMSALHGSWSLGGLAGAGLAGLMLGFLTATAHIAIVATAGVIAMAGAGLYLLPKVDVGQPGGWRISIPRGAALGLGVLAFLILLGEGAVLDWSAVYLRTMLSADTSTAAMGYAAFAGTMAFGRFAGDRLRGRMGAVRLTRVSALIAALGLGAGLAANNTFAAIAGFACAGLGFANLVPVMFSAAGRLPGQSPGVGIAAVATMGYAGFLAGPPLVGFVGEVSNMAIALALIPLSCLVVALAASIARAADAPIGEGSSPQFSEPTTSKTG